LKEIQESGLDAAGEVDKAVERVREIYERAVAQVPPGSEKRFWRRYIFLWLNYALFEEIETEVCLFFFIYFSLCPR
jgi:crooked neck